MKVLVAGGYELAEGARFVAGRLVYVDILSGRAFELVDGRPNQLLGLDVPLGAVAPVADRPGTWIAAAGTGIALLDTSGVVEWLARPEQDAPQPRRMNDGCCDPAGRFWAGSMAYDLTPGAGSLYRVDHDGTVTVALDGMTVVNGPAFSADGTLMYVADSPTGVIRRCRLDPASGQVLERTEFATVEQAGEPDGMTVDDTGRLWSAHWDGSLVRCYRPDGTVERDLAVPARRPTSVCIADGQLFVTTAANGLDDAGAAEGAVLATEVDASAAPAAGYRWSG